MAVIAQTAPISALIIDDSPDMRVLVRHYILVEWPEADIEEWDPLTRGKPPADYDWNRFDVVLLDYMLGKEDGLLWLKSFHRNPACPPVIFMTGQGSEDIAVQALKSGAADYLRKHDLSQARLVSSIREVAAPREHEPEPVLDHGSPFELPTMNVIGGKADDPSVAVARRAPGLPARSLNDAMADSGYRVIRRVGAGGMSTVYLAKRERDEATIVLKVLDGKLLHETEFLKRFIREYGIISKLDSPYVVKIYDQGFSDDHMYIAMEYFAGGDLKEQIDDGMDPDEALRLLAQIAKGLEAIHAAGVIHRDLKPQNIMFREDATLGILDFGIAKVVSEATQLTQHGQVFGTPYYMSPEQGTGAKLDGRSDIYSAGVIFYEMLTGRRLYNADNAVALVYKHLHDDIPLLPAALSLYQDLLDRAVAKAADERFVNASSLLKFLADEYGAQP
jgi:eukaryotic-like serine/threonine-protein kinase